MSEQNQELELYKLVTKNEIECRWVSDTEFLIWVPYYGIGEFINSLVETFGEYLFEDEGVKANLLTGDVCIDLTNMLSDYDLNLEIVFPKGEFKH